MISQHPKFETIKTNKLGLLQKHPPTSNGNFSLTFVHSPNGPPRRAGTRPIRARGKGARIPSHKRATGHHAIATPKQPFYLKRNVTGRTGVTLLRLSHGSGDRRRRPSPCGSPGAQGFYHLHADTTPLSPIFMLIPPRYHDLRRERSGICIKIYAKGGSVTVHLSDSAGTPSPSRSSLSHGHLISMTVLCRVPVLPRAVPVPAPQGPNHAGSHPVHGCQVATNRGRAGSAAQLSLWSDSWAAGGGVGPRRGAHRERPAVPGPGRSGPAATPPAPFPDPSIARGRGGHAGPRQGEGPCNSVIARRGLRGTAGRRLTRRLGERRAETHTMVR